ncbi:MAG: class B sortase [Clostridium sp.]|nr:class B sortase [Clostridium sp.]
MTADKLTVAGRRFRTRTDYEAALRDQKKIDAIKSKVNFDDPKQVYKLYGELQVGSYRFETQVGNDFDDEIYEKIESLKKQGITLANADDASKKKAAAAKHRKQPLRLKNSAGRLKNEKQPGGRTGQRAGDKNYAAQTAPNKGLTGPPGSGERQAAAPIRLEDYDEEMQQQILEVLKKKERFRKILVACASIVAVASFAYFGVYSFFSERTSTDYTELAALKGSDTLVSTQSKNPFSLHKQAIKLPDVLDEYKTLYEKNKKLIGWLKIDDTIIDYPVMQTDDNEYYLDHNFNQEYDRNGSLFLDYGCNIYPRSTNLIIYGHHMKSGQMFGQLQKYAKESYGEKHSIIQFDSIYEKAAYQVMYVFRSQVYNEDDFVFKYYQFIDANSEEEFNSYMKEMAELSLYDTGVTASYGDSLLTLSTCDNSQSDGRFVVVAKRIE